MIREERSIGELFSDLSAGTSTLVRKEVQLAKAELTQKVSTAGKNVGLLAAGGAVAYAGFLTLLAAVVLGLSEFMPGWLAALLVGVIVAGVGYLVLQKGLETLKKMDPKPTRTVTTLEEDKEWLKQQLR